MQSHLNIAMVQVDLEWESPESNRQMFEKIIKELPAETDLVVLPEMFATGFTMVPQKIAETMDGPTISWLRTITSEFKVAVCGSLVISENNRFYNRFVMMEENGRHYIYDKRHTFTLSGENEVYERGSKKVIIDFKGWRICPQVCYDLRFPVWSRNVEDYDMLIYVANWPKERIDAWDALLKARAIENMSYCIGVNRTGSDGNGYEFSGHSATYNGLGKRIAEFEDSENGVKCIKLEHSHLVDIRERLKFLADRDSFNLEV